VWHKIIIVLFFVLVLGVVLYIVRSGIIDKTLTLLNAITTAFHPSTSTISNPPNPIYRPQPTPAPQPVNQPLAQPSSPSINPSEIPQGFTEKDLSPWFHKVRIGGVSPGSVFYYGQISLYANLSGSEGVNVTGWLLKSQRGGQFIPRAVNVYDPVGLPVESDIYLRANDTIYIYSSQSAVGLNLRLNKCIGYLENANHFTPPLPLNCPYIDRSEVQSFSGRCQDYILFLGSCRLPDPNPLIPNTDYACRSFLDTINQHGCFEKHRNDTDFLSHEIRVWTGGTFLDPSHDRLLLLDNKGLVVDAYQY